MHYKPDWPQVKERFLALWENEIVDRCCVSVMAPKDNSGFSKEEIWKRMQDTHRLTYLYWDDPDRIVEELEITLAAVFFGGEALPHLSMNFGASGHAAYFGSPHVIDEWTVWLQASLKDWSQPLAFDWDCEMLQVQLRCAERFAELAKGRFFVSSLDNAGSLDALAHLRGNENLLMDLVVNEQEVLDALHIVIAGWDRVNERMYQIFRDCNDGGSMVGWLNTWADGKFSQLQADISVMLSNDMFKKFLVPEMQETIARQEYSLYHFDGMDQMRHLDDLLALEGLGIIQWTSVVNQPSYLEFIPVFKKIQRAGKGILINQVDIHDVETLLQELSPKGLYIQTVAQSEGEARQLLRDVERWSLRS